MKREFREYQKKKEYLLCVDSDGSAMDTMEIKHVSCFGPELVKTWCLEAHEKTILTIWNDINLYSVNRGINRFLGLVHVLEYIDRCISPIEGLDALRQWAENTHELSNAALIRYIEDHDSPILRKALRWSQAVSLHISLLPVEERRPFGGVAEALLAAREDSDIVVVSAANPDAMEEEWELHGLAYYVDLILNQNAGTKSYCVSELIAKGYEPKKVIMIGDAMEDLDVARSCGICFYPIIIYKEEASWRRFEEEALRRFYDGTYAGAYENRLIEEFTQALNADCV